LRSKNPLKTESANLHPVAVAVVVELEPALGKQKEKPGAVRKKPFIKRKPEAHF